jgi:hypothetical protein
VAEKQQLCDDYNTLEFLLQGKQLALQMPKEQQTASRRSVSYGTQVRFHVFRILTVPVYYA